MKTMSNEDTDLINEDALEVKEEEEEEEEEEKKEDQNPLRDIHKLFPELRNPGSSTRPSTPGASFT